MMTKPGEAFLELLAEPDETEATARMLYLTFGGFVQWDLLPEDGQSKQDYRDKARSLLEMLAVYREHHGRVEAPLQPTPEMLEAGYRAMLDNRPRPAPTLPGYDEPSLEFISVQQQEPDSTTS